MGNSLSCWLRNFRGCNFQSKIITHLIWDYFFAQVGFLIAAKTGTTLHSAHPVSLCLSLVSSCPVALSKNESLALYYLYGHVQAVSYDSYLGSTQTNNQGCSSVLTKLSSKNIRLVTKVVFWGRSNVGIDFQIKLFRAEEAAAFICIKSTLYFLWQLV